MVCTVYLRNSTIVIHRWYRIQNNIWSCGDICSMGPKCIRAAAV